MNTLCRFTRHFWTPNSSSLMAYPELEFFKRISSGKTFPILFLWATLGWSGCGSGNQPDKLSSTPQPGKSVVEFPLYQLSDPDSRFSLKQVHQLPLSRWKRVPAINFGYRGGTGWAYSSVYSDRRQTVWLELQSHFIDSVQVWLTTGSGTIQEYPTTGFWQLSQAAHNPLQHRYFLFDFPLEAKQTYQIFIRGYVVPGVTLKFAIRYWEPTQLLNYFRRVHWGWAIFVGIMFMASGLALVNFVLHPRSIYLYYVGYIMCLSLYALFNDGWGIFFPSFIHSWLNPVSVGVLIMGGVYFLLQFSRQFLSYNVPHFMDR